MSILSFVTAWSECGFCEQRFKESQLLVCDDCEKCVCVSCAGFDSFPEEDDEEWFCRVCSLPEAVLKRKRASEEDEEAEEEGAAAAVAPMESDASKANPVVISQSDEEDEFDFDAPQDDLDDSDEDGEDDDENKEANSENAAVVDALRVGSKVKLLFNGEWFGARKGRDKPAGMQFIFLVDGSSTIVPFKEIGQRIKLSEAVAAAAVAAAGAAATAAAAGAPQHSGAGEDLRRWLVAGAAAPGLRRGPAARLRLD